MNINLFSTKILPHPKNADKKKFELVSCPLNGKYCKSVLTSMNKDYAESAVKLQNKEFDIAIDLLKNAHNKTKELTNSPCSNCAAHFRSTINDSVENIHSELISMTKGLFRTNRFHVSCEKAEQTLNEFENNKKAEGVFNKLRNGKKELKYAV